MSNIIPLQVKDLTRSNRREKSGINREYGLFNVTFNLNYGDMILLIGARGAGKGAVIDSIDKKGEDVKFAKGIVKLRINDVNELKNKELGRNTLILSEGHNFAKQEPIIFEARRNGCMLLASMDRDQVTIRERLHLFTYIMLLNEGNLVIVDNPGSFFKKLPELIAKLPNLEKDFHELKTLINTQFCKSGH